MKKVKILLVEDNEGDIILTNEVLKETNIPHEVIIAMDGQQALEMLSMPDLPDLVLLDINLPKINGLEVLSTIKKDERLKRIPVIMLSTSSAESDIKFSYDHHANCFITKPVDLEKFIEVVKTIEDFWTNIARLPH